MLWIYLLAPAPHHKIEGYFFIAKQKGQPSSTHTCMTHLQNIMGVLKRNKVINSNVKWKRLYLHVDVFSKQRNKKENLGYIFVSYF